MSVVFWPLVYMGLLFVGHGVNMPYMPVWFEKVRHLDGGQIGIVLSIASLARFITGPLITAWVEGLKDPRLGYAGLALGFVLAFLAAAASPNLPLLAAAVFVAQTFFSALFPYAEGSVLMATARGEGVSYGVARAIGSAAFIIASLIAGALLGIFGPWVAWFWVVGAGTLLAIAAFKMPPPIAQPKEAPRQGFRGRLKVMRGLILEPNFARILVGVALIQAGHAFMYNFGSLTWLHQGHSSNAIGFLWAVGVVAEIFLLTFSAKLLDGRKLETLMMVGGAAGIVRWGLSALAPPFAVLILVQMLHAGSFALTHFATMRWIERIGHDRMPVAQTLFFALGSGTMTGLATLGSGVLYQAFGARGFGAMSLVCLAGVLFIASAHRQRHAVAPV